MDTPLGAVQYRRRKQFLTTIGYLCSWSYSAENDFRATPPSAIDISQHGLPQLPSTISPWIDKAIRTAMQPIKESRPASVQQFITIIHERKAAPEETIFSGTVEKEKDKKRSSIVGKTLLIALLVAAVIGVIYVMNQSSAVNMPDVVTEDNMPIPYEEPLNEAPSNNDLKTKRYSKEVDSSTGTNKLNIDYPTSGNAILLQNIREWINEELGGTYDGDLNDGATFFAYYTKGLDNNEEDGYSTTDIKKPMRQAKSSHISKTATHMPVALMDMVLP